jgi:ubiquinone/menaquinone biosynthesis C-methylase UbiE
MIDSLKNIIKNEKFHPGLIGLFINHNFLIRTEIRKAIQNNASFLKGQMLDFGCGTKPYKAFFQNINNYVGVDYKIEGREEKQKEVDVFYDGKNIPFANDYFDSILCTEVLEHVFNIDELLQEFYRVLKKDGVILLTTPFMWEEHEMPYDFARYTTPALIHLYTKNGFCVEKNFKTGNYVKVIAQFNLNYIKNILPDNKFVKHSVLLLFIFPINFIGFLFSLILPEEQTAYFNNVFVLTKK